MAQPNRPAFTGPLLSLAEESVRTPSILIRSHLGHFRVPLRLDPTGDREAVMDPASPRGLAWIAYRPLLLGVVASFCACVVTGWALRKANCYRDVQRFHPGINYQSLHYPTVPHVRAM